MRYFEEYCEVHLESGVPPYTWVFKSDEKIRIRFGVSLDKDPDCGQIFYESNDGYGHHDFCRIKAHTDGLVENGFKMFSVTLPPLKEGGYRYKLGYRGIDGQEHVSQLSRVVYVCDDAPRSITEIRSKFLGFINHQPLYGPHPQVPITPGPEDWQRRLFYSLIIDRFAQGSACDRRGLGMVPYDPSSPYGSHGGTLQGVIEQLEYLSALGVRALIISPVYTNEPSGYHGYHPIHLLMVAPRLGTLRTLQDLVNKAHEVGIGIILDVVVNHLADSIDWEEYGGPPGGEFKYVRGDETAVMPLPVEAQNTVLFHSPAYTDMINQRLFGFLEDWRTETTYVRELLIQHLKYWLAVTNVDGFRYDSARHVGLDFWEPCVAEISRYATYLGKQQFLQIAEHAGSSHGELTAYNRANFSGFLDYPTHYTLKHSLGNGDWLEGFADYFCGFLIPDQTYTNGWRQNLMFLDNQDTTRILHEFLSRHEQRDMAQSCLHFALACLILGPQRPIIYAGTEQEFSGALGMHQREDTGEWIGHDCHVREDMFHNPACVWKFGPINQKVFEPYNQNHETFKIISQLARIRAQTFLLQIGNRTVFSSEEHGLRSVIIHDAQGSPPLIAIMNLGLTELTKSKLAIPQGYGRIRGVDIQVATIGSTLQWVNGHIHAQLPPFAFILGQILTATSKPHLN
ncbi:MAG: alpha-amylase [Symploca sp. SIO1A3]|nr:alpha-amylase [Symploca sp. SIO1A3]